MRLLFRIATWLFLFIGVAFTLVGGFSIAAAAKPHEGPATSGMGVMVFFVGIGGFVLGALMVVLGVVFLLLQNQKR